MARVLVVLALGVGGLLVALWIMISSDAAPGAAAAGGTTPVAAAPADAGVRSAPSVRSRVGAKGVPAMRRPPVTGSSTAAPSAPALEIEPPPGDAAPRKEPPAFWHTLRFQVLDTETWILECNERAQKQGIQLSGKAAYSFVVARKDGKIVIESTGTEYSQFPAPFSECMRDASHKMVFEELPEGVDALIAYRKVVFEDGALKENWMTEFHTLRPAPVGN